jgi:hypothetical protein
LLLERPTLFGIFSADIMVRPRHADWRLLIVDC